MAAIRRTFGANNLPLQFGLLGAVEAGGGGTISKYLASRGAAVIDLGVCVISMHSPFELVAKTDLWITYQGLRAWFAEKP
jgi:aspartyl aminopeptidase